MKQKPLIIKAIAIAYFLNPVFFILQYFYFSQAPFTDTFTWQSLVTPYKLISFIILPPIVGLGIWKIRVWGWYVFLVHAFYVVGNNTLAFLGGSRTPPWAIIAFTIATLVVIGIFVQRAIRAPYFNPRIRWWEHKPRFAITLNVEMGNDQKRLAGETFNISEGGFFIVNEQDVNIGEEYSVKLSQNGKTPVNAEGRIVWVNPAGEKLPQGFGVMFTRLEKTSLQEICNYIRKQKKVLKEQALYR